MLKIILKKINRNKWLVSCLLIGLVFSMAIVSAIPMYSRGILHKLIKNDLETYQSKYKIYPGLYMFSKKIGDVFEEDLTPASMGRWEERPRDYKDMPSNKKEFASKFNEADKRILGKLIPEIKLPVNASIKILTAYKFVFKEQKDGSVINKDEFGRLDAIYNMEEHIKIIDGRMFSSNKTSDGEYEIIVPEEAMNTLKLAKGKTYYVYQPGYDYINPDKYFKVKIVGIYTIKDSKDPVWFDRWELISGRGFAMDYSLFEKDFLSNPDSFLVLNDMYWSFAFDYRKIFPQNVPDLIATLEEHTESQKKLKHPETFFPTQTTLEVFIGREKQVKTMMWLFEVPVLIILLIYIFMITNMMVEQDRDEIAVLRGRGASKKNILAIYLLESLLFGGISIIIGPLIGYYICNLIGAANGFLEFVNRARMDVALSLEAYTYSFIVLILFLAIVLISISSGLKQSIVERKQTKTRFVKKPVWQKFYFDIILLIMCGYGYYSYTIRKDIIMASGNRAFVPVDPIVYLVSSCFVLGMGMFLLRIYPVIIKGVFRIGRDKWSSILYASLINVARSDGKNQFIMLFLILTVSFGIFNMKAGRTINTNIKESIGYLSGADIVIKEAWESNLDSMETGEKAKYRGPIVYKEPDFSRYSKIEGIEYATSVFRIPEFTITGGGMNVHNAYLMGIKPEEFRYVAWLKNTPELYDLCFDILETYSDAVILSSSFAELQGFKLEDNIRISLNGGMYFNGYVAGFVDYWPSFNTKEISTNHFVIANFDYLESNRILLPYEVWIKRDMNVSEDKIYNSIKNNGFKIEKLIDENQELIKRKNDPVLQGTNGALSLGFIAIMMITLAGFVIYWVMCVKGRVLQYGIIRSLGLTRKKMVGMITWEQVFTSGTAVLCGTIIGEINSVLFLPIVQVTSKNQDQVLPFKIVITSGDYLKLYILLSIILLAGFIVLAKNIYNLKIDQALKLGED